MDTIREMVLRDPDLWFVIGLVVLVLSVPSLISAWSDRRCPWATGVTVLIAVGMIWLAIDLNPGAYSLTAIPDVLVNVVGRYLI